jgi:hypothetical protein
MTSHLAIDGRGLCLVLGYSSLFAYCREALGFCKSSAGRRIAAARVCRKYPEAFERVAKGELQLSVLCALGQYLTSENAAELFAACSRKSYEQVEMLLAVRFPKADVRDLIRRLPARVVESAPDIGTSRAAASEASTGAAPHPPRRSDVQPAAQIQPAPRETAQTAPARGAVKPLSEARFSELQRRHRQVLRQGLLHRLLEREHVRYRYRSDRLRQGRRRVQQLRRHESVHPGHLHRRGRVHPPSGHTGNGLLGRKCLQWRRDLQRHHLQPGDRAGCNDGKPCTTDSCEPASGCKFVNNDAATCSDGSACTVNDKCQAGECLPGTALPCLATTANRARTIAAIPRAAVSTTTSTPTPARTATTARRVITAPPASALRRLDRTATTERRAA